MRLKTIGVLGGMGPASTAHFLRLFVEEMNKRGAKEDSNFPRILTLFLPLTDFGVTGTLEKNSVASQVSRGVEWLLSAGAEVIAVPCCSVHEFYPFGAKEDQVLNIIDETLRRCGDAGRLGILSSRQTKEARLFERMGHRVYYGFQEFVDIAIGKIMAGETADISEMSNPTYFKPADREPFRIDAVILGCTELSLCERGKRGPIVDASRCLAEALADAVI